MGLDIIKTRQFTQIKVSKRKIFLYVILLNTIFDKCSLSNSARVKERRRSGVFIVNFEQILHFALAFLLLTLSR